MPHKDCATQDAPYIDTPRAPLTAANDNDFNPEDYLQDLKEFDLSEDQKRELLQTLWTILCTFVDIGWGVETVQLFLPELFEKAGQDSENTVEIKNAHSNANHTGGEHE